MKTCTKCLVVKQLDSFGRWSSSKDGLYHICKPCRSKYDSNNKNRKQTLRASNKRARDAARQILNEIKAERGCADCGTRNPIVLDFDHLHDKKYNLSTIAGMGYSIDTILNEVKKCEVVCSNCHRIRTHNRRILRSRSLELKAVACHATEAGELPVGSATLIPGFNSP